MSETPLNYSEYRMDGMTDSEQTLRDSSESQPGMQPGTTPHVKAFHAICYWYGKIFFKALVAETIIRNDEGPASPLEIDAALVTAMKDFPTGKCLTRLANVPGVHIPEDLNTKDDFCQLMTALGATSCRADASAKRAVAIAVQSCISNTVPNVDHWETVPPPSPPLSVHTEFRHRPSPNPSAGSPEGKPLHMYTSKLSEWSQYHKDVPVIPEDLGSQEAGTFAEWAWTWTVRNKVFEGKAMTKKDAKHIASKKACEYLGIYV